MHTDSTWALKPKQKEVLESIQLNDSTLAILPTGYGKSLCYWYPAKVWGWKVLVISPLVSLMEDQVASMEKLNISVVALHSGLCQSVRRNREKKFLSGNVQICFISPERLYQWYESGFLSQAVKLGLGFDLLALDEFHCFGQWSDFRSHYLAAIEPIRYLRLQNCKTVALTATLSRKTGLSWLSDFGFEANAVEAPLVRKNLGIFIKPVLEGESKELLLLSSLRELAPNETAIVYCATRSETERVCSFLRASGFEAIFYHAGLSVAEKKTRLQAFSQGCLSIICATTAFGLGVSYAKVHRVILYDPPTSIEEYWQQAGRAGRNGEAAFVLALWSRSDVELAKAMNAKAREAYFALWCLWLGDGCRVKAVSDYFEIEMQTNCENCDQCLNSRPLLWPKVIQWFASKQLPWWLEFKDEANDWAGEKILDRENFSDSVLPIDD